MKKPGNKAKVARVRAYLRDTGLAGVLISRQDNFAWLTAGRDNRVVDSSDSRSGNSSAIGAS